MGGRLWSGVLAACGFFVASAADNVANPPSASPAASRLDEAINGWSLRPLVCPTVPALDANGYRWGRNPVDAFIWVTLRERHLSPSPEANRRTLIRRLYFDLLGLPPTPEEAARFVADTDPQTYEKLVDYLLGSPHYGERWARHWLDVVHYGDTHGYDKDKPRSNAWPYRDYVIRAFNDDKPYARFVQEQLAGDVLFPGTRDGIEALGFIAAGPWDLIGHMEVPETKIDGKVARNLDRDDMVSNAMNTFTSLTVQCARCHNHKFDPVTQQDYYNLQAVFAALDRADKSYDLDPLVATHRVELEARRKKLEKTKAGLHAAAAKRISTPLAALDQRIAAMQKPEPGKSPKAAAYGFHSQIARTQATTKWVQVDLQRTVALAKIVLHPCRDAFNHIGDGFGFPVRFRIEISDDAEFVTGVSSIGDQSETDFPNPRLQAVSFPVNGQPARFVRVTATKLAPRKDDFIFALAELEVLDVTEKNIAAGTTVTALDSIEAPPRWRTVNLVDEYYPGAGRGGEPDELAKLHQERKHLIMEAMSGDGRRAFTEAGRLLADVEQAITRLPRPSVVYAGTVYSGTGAFRGTGPDGGRPRVIHVLHRGDVNSPKEEARPGALPLIPGCGAQFDLSSNEPEGARRVALARWITDPRNPLTWRSIVNRVWQYHMGRGIVDTPNDFGRMGQLPTHPELLDWLAVEFRDRGGSLKALHRLIVTSATYRQRSSAVTEDGSQGAMGKRGKPNTPALHNSTTPPSLDSENRFLWRMNRRKLEAEAVRDAVLAVAGRLDARMYGPGFQDFVIEKPEHSPHYRYDLWDPEDPRSHRRSIYRFIVRSQMQPFMTVLDCADPSMQVGKRNESVSALQALALLNNGFMVTMAKHFAQKLAARGGDLAGQVERGFSEAVGRPPTGEERAALVAYAQQHGLANACRVLFNLNEFSFVD